MIATRFQGLDDVESDQMASEVAHDELLMLDALAQQRRSAGISFETLAFMLGTAAGRISRLFDPESRISMRNYLLIARALGFRVRVVFEKVDDGRAHQLNKVAHRLAPRRSGSRRAGG